MRSGRSPWTRWATMHDEHENPHTPDDDDDEVFFDVPSPTAPAEPLEPEGPANAKITSEGDSADEERLDDDDEPLNWTDEDDEAVARSRRTIEPPPEPEHHRPNGEHDEPASSAPAKSPGLANKAEGEKAAVLPRAVALAYASTQTRLQIGVRRPKCRRPRPPLGT